MELGKIKSRNELVIFFNECGFKKGAEIGVGDGSFSEYIHEKIEDFLCPRNQTTLISVISKYLLTIDRVFFTFLLSLPMSKPLFLVS